MRSPQRNRVVSRRRSQAHSQQLNPVRGRRLSQRRNRQGFPLPSRPGNPVHNLLLNRLGGLAVSRAGNPVDSRPRSRLLSPPCNLRDSRPLSPLDNQVDSRAVNLVHSPRTPQHGPLRAPLGVLADPLVRRVLCLQKLQLQNGSLLWEIQSKSSKWRW